MERNKSARKRKREEQVGTAAVIKNGLMGAGIGTAISVVLLFVATFIAYANADPDSMTGVLGLAAAYIASMAAGFCSVRLNGRSALACGAISGGFLALIFFLVSLFIGEEYVSGYSIIVSLALRAAMILMAILGAYAGLHRSTGRRRKRRS